MLTSIELQLLPVSTVKEAPTQSVSSYRTALKATAITGLSSFIVVGLQIIKSKFIALLLGPAGIGLFGVLGSVASLVSTLSGFGINTSGVRQIAKAASSADEQVIARTVYTLRRTSLVLALLGAFLLVVFCRPLAQASTGSTELSWAVALLSLMVFFNIVEDGQAALLRGLRRIMELGTLRVIGAAAGTLVSLPLVYLYGATGIPVSMVAVAAIGLGASWYFARRVNVAKPVMRAQQFWQEVMELLTLGSAFLLTNLTGNAVKFGTRAIVVHQLGIAALGQYQAAAAFAFVYADYVLNAMGQDFLPRLTSVSGNNAASSRLINEQTQLCLLLATPGLVATIVLAPVIIPLFYSSQFSESIAVLRWLCLGVLLRVVTWPMSYLLVANNMRRIYLGFELGAAAYSLGTFWLLTVYGGLVGAAAAFPVLYIYRILVMIQLARRAIGFRWSRQTRNVILKSLAVFTLALLVVGTLPPLQAAAGGAVLLTVSGYDSYRGISARVGTDLRRMALDRVKSIRHRRLAR